MSKFTGDYALPDFFFIVGLDDPPEGLDMSRVAHLEDPHHIHLPIPQALIDIVREDGHDHPVKVLSLKYGRSGKVYPVVDGRTRIRATRRVNDEFAAERVPREKWIKVPYIIVDPDTVDFRTPVRDNRRGRIDDILTRGRVCVDMKKKGASIEEIQRLMGAEQGSDKLVSRQVLANWMSLTKLAPEIQAAIASGVLSPTAGYDLARLSPAQQMTAFAGLMAPSVVPLTETPAAQATAPAAPTDPMGALAALQGSLPPKAPAAPAAPKKAPTAKEAKAAVAAVQSGKSPVVRVSDSPLTKIPSHRQLAELAEKLTSNMTEDAAGYTAEERAEAERDNAIATVLRWAAGQAPYRALEELDDHIARCVREVMTPAKPTPPSGPRIL